MDKDLSTNVHNAKIILIDEMVVCGPTVTPLSVLIFPDPIGVFLPQQ